jgi:SAM-dependent methyltransferase
MKKTRSVKKLLFKKAAYPLVEMIPLLEQWFDSDFGKELLKQEQQLIDESLETLFGYHLMQLSVSRRVTLFSASKIGHRFMLNPLSGYTVAGVIDEEQLPIATESIDLALLHHTLEYTQRPHQLLTEAARTVVPSGYVLIAGINPFSLMGLWSIFGRFRGKTHWNNRLLTLPRLADWLTLLGFSVQSIHYGFYRLPLNRSCVKKPSWIGRLLHYLQLPFGGFYLVLAKKEVSTLTPIKPRRHRGTASMIPMMEPSLYTPKPDKTKNSSE